jgi:hypothetical protein
MLIMFLQQTVVGYPPPVNQLSLVLMGLSLPAQLHESVHKCLLHDLPQTGSWSYTEGFPDAKRTVPSLVVHAPADLPIVCHISTLHILQQFLPACLCLFLQRALLPIDPF